MTLHDILFVLLAVLTAVSALAVVVVQNIVRAATWLLFTLAGTAGVFFLLGADFLGAAQLLIYVGGTLVLVVFGVMLTAQGPFINLRISAAEWAIALFVGLALYGTLAVCLMDVKRPTTVARRRGAGEQSHSLLPSKHLGAALLGDATATPRGKLTGPEPLRELERSRMSYLLPFEMVSVHLLVVLIGAAYLARAKRRKEAAPS